MVVIQLFNFEHVKRERKFNFDTNNINMLFKQNKNNLSTKFSLLVNQYVTETLLAPAACAAQLNMIDIQTIFIKIRADPPYTQNMQAA